MLKIHKYAAIDIGSNAVRLLISDVIEQDGQPPIFRKNSLVRVPIRLGEDVFKSQEISERNILRLKEAVLAFHLLMKSHEISKYKACATSAMREAANGYEVTQEIKKTTNITIDIIDGKEEANTIAATGLNQFVSDGSTYLYVDVGGGSTEFTIFHNGQTVVSKSVKIGTVRLLNGLVEEDTWNDLQSWIRYHTQSYNKIDIIGSGGNINKIFKLSGKQLGKPITYFYMSSLYKRLNSLTYEKRITDLGLNQDRADVIIPATRIFLSAMKWSKSKYIYVPKIGLADGIIKRMYYGTIDSHQVQSLALNLLNT